MDIACGTGNYSIELATLGHLVTAIDLDQQMVEITKAKALNLGLNVNVFKKDMLSLNLEKPFDTIFCIGNSLIGNIKS